MGLDGRPVKKRKTTNSEHPKGTQKQLKASTSASAALVKPTKEKQKKKAPRIVPEHEKSVSKASTSTVNTNTRLIVVAGSYDRVLYGLQIEHQKKDAEEKPQFKPIFVFPAHISCVKAVAASPQGGKWLATGGTDETVKVWDLRRKKELGRLQQHQGSITYLSFPTRSHLVSAAEDGSICLYHTRDWAVLATLNGHRDRVNDLAIHPSAKVCLSVGKDRTLRMWDLMRGKGSASVKLGKEGEGVRWTPSGTRFAVFAGSGIDIYSTKMALLHTIAHPARIHGVYFCQTNADREVLLVAAEDKQVTIYLMPRLEADLEEATTPIIGYLSGHTNRVKALDVLASQNATFATTVSSDGLIHLYDLTAVLETLDVAEPLNIEPIAVYDTKGSRLTCVTITEAEEDRMESRKRKLVAESDEESDGSEEDV